MAWTEEEHLHFLQGLQQLGKVCPAELADIHRQLNPGIRSRRWNIRSASKPRRLGSAGLCSDLTERTGACQGRGRLGLLRCWVLTPHRAMVLTRQCCAPQGQWREISKHFVPTRTSTQVASHAQKHFIRQSDGKRKRRSSLFDLQVPEAVRTRLLPAASMPRAPCCLQLLSGLLGFMIKRPESQKAKPALDTDTRLLASSGSTWCLSGNRAPLQVAAVFCNCAT